MIGNQPEFDVSYQNIGNKRGYHKREYFPNKGTPEFLQSDQTKKILLQIADYILAKQ
jgi:hypothetical protein